MEITTDTLDLQDDPITSVTESMQTMEITDEENDIWSSDPMATAKLRLMFDSMQARLTAVASIEEIAFLQRTFDLNVTQGNKPKQQSYLRESAGKIASSPRKRGVSKERAASKERTVSKNTVVSKGPKGPVLSPRRKVIPSSPTSKVIPSSPTSKRDNGMRLTTADDESMTNISFAMSPPATPGTTAKANKFVSATTAKKSRQPTASATQVYAAATPSRVTRHSSISSTTGIGGVGGGGGENGASKTPRLSPKSSSLGSAVRAGSNASSASNASTISIATRGIPRMQVLSRTNSASSVTSDCSQPNVVRTLFASKSKHPVVASRYAQTAQTAQTAMPPSASASEKSIEIPVAGKRNSNNSTVSTSSARKPSNNNIRVPTSTTSSDLRLVSAVTVERPISVPVKKTAVPTPAIPVNQDTSKYQVVSSSADFSSNKPRPQSQRTPKRAPPPPVPQPPSSPSSLSGINGINGSHNNSSGSLVGKKAEIGKLFGLVGFNKGDGNQSGAPTPGSINSSVSWATDNDAVLLDRTMKDALQRSATAKATLKAAEMAAESARLDAAAAHAEAVAAARAIVREAEGTTASIKKTMSTSSGAIIPPSPTAIKNATPKPRENDLWMKSTTGVDEISPKREAENPFKGMF